MKKNFEKSFETVSSWKAVEQLLGLTYNARREKISTIKGLHAVSGMLEQFPYLEDEKVVRGMLWFLRLDLIAQRLCFG